MLQCTAAGAIGGIGVALSQVTYLRLNYVTPDEPTGRRNGCAGDFTGQPLRLLFVGDSVCMGVGARAAAPFQSACAERLAALRQAPVIWNTIAQTGADVRELREKILCSEECHFDIAVVVCGVNDGKKILQGQFPSMFREDLRALCTTLRNGGSDARIVVPRIPGYLCAPYLELFPMRYLVKLFFDLFERQKLSVADSELLESPTPPLDQLPSSTDPKMWAVDGLHPSDEGYRIVGHWLAHALITSD